MSVQMPSHAADPTVSAAAALELIAIAAGRSNSESLGHLSKTAGSMQRDAVRRKGREGDVSPETRTLFSRHSFGSLLSVLAMTKHLSDDEMKIIGRELSVAGETAKSLYLAHPDLLGPTTFERAQLQKQPDIEWVSLRHHQIRLAANGAAVRLGMWRISRKREGAWHMSIAGSSIASGATRESAIDAGHTEFERLFGPGSW